MLSDFKGHELTPQDRKVAWVTVASMQGSENGRDQPGPSENQARVTVISRFSVP